MSQNKKNSILRRFFVGFVVELGANFLCAIGMILGLFSFFIPYPLSIISGLLAIVFFFLFYVVFRFR